MVSKERINRPKLCFKVIKPRIIFIITRKIIFRCPFVHFSFFSFIFLWFSIFLLVPFSTFLFCSCSFLFFCGVSSTFFGTLTFQTCLPASGIWLKSNSCKGKRLQLFHFFFQIFLNLGFLIFVLTQSNFSSAWHDNQFFFFLSYFLICSLQATAYAIDGFPSWSTSSQCEDCFGRLAFWSIVVYIIYVRRKDYGLKVLPRNG